MQSIPTHEEVDRLTRVGNAQARKLRILDAAAQCFCKYGFRGATIAQISQVAGMSPGHIYHYFRNKEAIVAGIVERNLENVLDRVRGIRHASEKLGVVEACVAEVDPGIAVRSDKIPAALNLEMLAEATRNPVVARLMQSADALGRQSTRELLKQLPSLRKLPVKELDARITVMYTLFDGLVVRTFLDPKLNRGAAGKVIRRVVRALLEDEQFD